MLLDHLTAVGGGKRGQTTLGWQAAGSGVRVKMLALAARRGDGWWVMSAPRAHGTGTAARSPAPDPSLSARTQWPMTRLPSGWLLTFSSVSSEDSLSKGKVKPSACTLSPLNSKGRALPPSSTPVCSGGLRGPAPRVTGRSTDTCEHCFFSSLFSCDCPHMT